MEFTFHKRVSLSPRDHTWSLLLSELTSVSVEFLRILLLFLFIFLGIYLYSVSGVVTLLLLRPLFYTIVWILGLTSESVTQNSLPRLRVFHFPWYFTSKSVYVLVDRYTRKSVGTYFYHKRESWSWNRGLFQYPHTFSVTSYFIRRQEWNGHSGCSFY